MLAGPITDKCVLVGMPELELAGEGVLRCRGWNPSESSAAFNESVAFPFSSGNPGLFCELKNRRSSLRESLDMTVE